MIYDLSVIIPSRNEMFLAKTVENVLENIEGNTEIIVIMDGYWADPPVYEHERVTIIQHNVSIGQRASTNEGARLSKAKFMMKLDAHCAVDKGFDVKLMRDCEYDWTVIPRMYNLHAFNWVCKTCGWNNYQGPTPEKCPTCGDKPAREIIWKPRLSRVSDFMRFDKELRFNYWGAFKERKEAQGDIADTMSCLGACWFMHRQRYWDIGGLDEAHGSWGQVGTELSCKTWLSGGRMVVNKKTWFSHMFRTQGGDFGFPYEMHNKDVDKARDYSRNLWLNDRWPMAKYKLQWLIDKFAPIPGWHEEKPVQVTTEAHTEQKSDIPTKGILFYTDNCLNIRVAHAVQKQLKRISESKRLPIVSVSLKPMNFGQNIHLSLPRGYLTMSKQILAGLEALQTDFVFLCEHDVLYHPSHFDFTPERKDVYYYNTNVWRVRLEDGHALWCDDLRQLSGLVAARETLIAHVKERIRRLEERLSKNPDEHSFNHYIRQMGFEPGTHNRPDRVDDLKASDYKSEHPNIDIRHEGNLTPSRWQKDQFVNEQYTRGWKEADTVSPWNWEKGKFLEFIKFL